MTQNLFQDLTNCQRITNEGLIAVAFNNPTIQVLKFNDTLLHLQEVTKVILAILQNFLTDRSNQMIANAVNECSDFH